MGHDLAKLVESQVELFHELPFDRWGLNIAV
jgi:hypothetical protein